MNELQDIWRVVITENNGKPIKGEEISNKISSHVIENEKAIQIFVKNIKITGCIYLADISMAGKKIPTLVFIGCDIDSIEMSSCECGRLYIENTKFRSLRAVDSKFLFGVYINKVDFEEYKKNCTPPQLNFYGSDVEGDFTLINVNFPEASRGSLQLSNITISGSCIISHCQIASNLDLSECKILCSLSIFETVLSKELHMVNSFIDGHFQAQRCERIGDGKTAIDGEGLEVGGAILLWNSKFEGCIHIIQSNVGVNMELKNCQVNIVSNNKPSAAYFNGTAVRGKFYVHASRFDGGLNIDYTNISGSVDIEHSKFFSERPDGRYLLSAVNCVAKNFTVFASHIQTGICLDGLICECNVYLNDIKFRPVTSFKISKNQNIVYILMRNAEVKALLSFNRVKREGAITVGLNGARVGELHVDEDFCREVVSHMQGTLFDRYDVSSDQKILQLCHILLVAAAHTLASDKSISLQPFIQFSNYLRQSGRLAEADNLIVEMKRLIRFSMSKSVKRPYLGFTIKHLDTG